MNFAIFWTELALFSTKRLAISGHLEIGCRLSSMEKPRWCCAFGTTLFFLSSGSLGCMENIGNPGLTHRPESCLKKQE